MENIIIIGGLMFIAYHYLHPAAGPAVIGTTTAMFPAVTPPAIRPLPVVPFGNQGGGGGSGNVSERQYPITPYLGGPNYEGFSDSFFNNRFGESGGGRPSYRDQYPGRPGVIRVEDLFHELSR